MSSPAPTPAGFRDHFSRDPNSYARFRPRYPAGLFVWLASRAPARRTAWDCATGTGQAATMLAAHFARVIATDASRLQLRAAGPAPRVHYAAALGEASPLAGGRADLITVAQALHWLDRPRLYAEVSRVIVPGGVFAVWCYGLLQSTPEIDAAIFRLYRDVVGGYWPPERSEVETGYRNIEIPIEQAAAPRFAIEAELTLAELVGYIGTWSAVGRYIADLGEDPLAPFSAELERLWGDPAAARPVVWPLSVRAGRWLGA
jgi:SAM-dependent methyltransferase